MKTDVLDQLTTRLEQIRIRERLFREPVDSLTLEGQLKWLARSAGAKRHDLMYGTAICFDSFSSEQRKTLFELLISIEEDIPRRDLINWSRYLRMDR